MKRLISQLTVLCCAKIEITHSFFNYYLISGKESIFLTIKAHPAQGVYGVNPTCLDFCDDHGKAEMKVKARMINNSIVNLRIPRSPNLGSDAYFHHRSKRGKSGRYLPPCRKCDRDARDQGSYELQPQLQGARCRGECSCKPNQGTITPLAVTNRFTRSLTFIISRPSLSFSHKRCGIGNCRSPY